MISLFFLKGFSSGAQFLLISEENLEQLNWYVHQLLRLSPMQTLSQIIAISKVWSEGDLLQKYPIPICHDLGILLSRRWLLNCSSFLGKVVLLLVSISVILPPNCSQEVLVRNSIPYRRLSFCFWRTCNVFEELNHTLMIASFFHFYFNYL
jgi:hypothetical protein